VPPAKRKLDFSETDEDCGPSIAPVPSSTIGDEDLNQSLTGVEHLEDEDEDDTAITAFAIVGREGNMQPLPFIESYVTTTASGGDFSKSPYNMTRVVLPKIDSPDISALSLVVFFIIIIFRRVEVVFAHNIHMPFKYYEPVQYIYIYRFFADCGQQFDHPSSSQALSEGTQSMDTSEIEKIFLATTYQVLPKVLNGLDVTTLKEPERCDALQLTSASLPGNFASISKIKAMLDKLVDTSKQLQLAYFEFEASSERVDQACLEGTGGEEETATGDSICPGFRSEEAGTGAT
jgi:hypothetical protein